MNIVLIGYRGTGKSAVGKSLASMTGKQLVSTDQEIVRRAGKTIPEMVSEHGWEYFRDVESAVVEESSAKEGLILDCGGGVVLRERNRLSLRQNGFVVWLTADIPTIIKRISDDTQRPSLTGKMSFVDEIAAVLAERIPIYRETAHLTIQTDDRTPDQIAEMVLRETDVHADATRT